MAVVYLVYKGMAKYLKALLKRCEIKWVAKSFAFERYKSLVMMTPLQNIVISGVQNLLILMGSKFLMK